MHSIHIGRKERRKVVPRGKKVVPQYQDKFLDFFFVCFFFPSELATQRKQPQKCETFPDTANETEMMSSISLNFRKRTRAEIGVVVAVLETARTHTHTHTHTHTQSYMTANKIRID